MLLRARDAAIVLLVMSVAGCKGGKITDGKSGSASTAAPVTSGTTGPVTSGTTGPVSSGTTPPVTPPAPTPFQLTSAAFSDVDKNGVASKGDTLTLTFSKEVKLAATDDPAKELKLLVVGDSFGTAPSMASVQGKPMDLIVTLGDKPVLRVSGKYDKAALVKGDPSGIDVAAATALEDLQGNKATSFEVDLDGALQASFVPASTLQVARGHHTATLLDDGRVLIVGGLTKAAGGGAAFTIEPEVYDPLANTFTKTSATTLGGTQGYMLVNAGNGQALPVVRVFHTATKLKDGRVLIVGGLGWERLDPATGQPKQEDLRSAHLFDPKTNRFTVVPSLMSLARSSHYAVLLSNGKVLIAGGFNGTLNNGQGATLPAAELFDPVANTFAPLSTTGQDMTAPRQDGFAVELTASKQVLFVGGLAIAMPTGATKPQLYLSGAAEVFDEATSKFAATKGKPSADLRFQAGAVVGNAVFVVGGDAGKGPVAAIESYDAATGAFTGAGSLKTARSRATAVATGSRELTVGCGTVLSGQASHELASVELINTATGQVISSIDMKNARNGATATRLAAGGVLFVGGFAGDPGPSALSLGGNPVVDCEKLQLP